MTSSGHKAVDASSAAQSVDSEKEDSPVTCAMKSFLGLLHAVIQEPAMTPVIHFAMRFLELTVKQGRNGRSKLILGHLNPQTVLHLIKLLPESFSMTFVTQLFDAARSTGRKDMARTMCLLRNIRRKREFEKAEMNAM